MTSREDVAIRAMRLVHSETSRRPPPKVDKARDRKVAQLAERLKKKYQDDVLTTIAGGSRATNIRAVPSGWQAMDDLITGETDERCRTVDGTGLGWPLSRIVEIYGDEGVGKTTLALHIIVAFQRAGLLCAFVDAEHALDVSYAQKLGVDLGSMQLSQPDQGGERAMSVVNHLVASGLFGCVVVDSVAALVPETEMEADFEENVQPARQAALMSRSLRKLAGPVRTSGTLLVFINQTRMKIGVKFGNPRTTTGGYALRFYASVRIEMTNVKTVRKGDVVSMRRTRVRTVKNKVAPPFRDVFCDVVPNKGIVTVHGDPDLGGSGDD